MKRKQGGSGRGCSIMEGQFTRSKSQIYLHCNRSGRVRVDSAKFKRSDHQLQQLDPPVKKLKMLIVQNPEGSLDRCEISRTPVKDLRARRVFSSPSVVLENDGNLKKSESPLLKEKNEIKGDGKMGTESNGNRNGGVQKSNSAVSSSFRRKVFIARSSFSYRRLLPYLTEAAREYSDVSETEIRDMESKSNNSTLSYLKPDLQSMASNGSTSEDKHVGANSDVSKLLRSVEGQQIEVNISCNPQDLNDVPDVLSQTRVDPQVFTEVGGLDPEALEECVQTTPPDADILCKADVSNLGASIEHNVEQTQKFFVGHPSDRRNGCIVKKSSLSPGRNGSASRNKLALNPCSRLKVFKAVNSVSYRRLLPFLMDVAKSDSGGASSENGHTKSQRDLECNRPLMSVSKEVLMNKEYSPMKDETKEQETKILEPKCISANDVSDCLNTCLPMENLSSAAESFNEKPSSVFPDDIAYPQTLLNVEIRKSETECTDASTTEKSEPECLNNEINNFNTGENCPGVTSNSNVSPETSTGEYKVDTTNLLPISLEDLLSEYGVEVPKVGPVSPEGDRMTLKVDHHEEASNLIEVIGSNCCEPTGTVGKELFLKVSEPEPITKESSCKVLLADSNEETSAVEAVALIKASSSTEPSDLSEYSNDGLTKTLCKESIQKISESEPSDAPNKNGCLEPTICHQKSTLSESSYDLVTRPDLLNKGILKRNPRGCRGLCNCLNCVSFRLHAERAFEFSTNQMQDSEEVALGLMKELANMRIFLEKHLSSENDLAPIPLSQLEVEEACTKALEAEQLAKERLSQMNNELHYHCRVPPLYRPRVTFASSIEEKTVQKIESSSSKSEKEDIKARAKRGRKKHQ
ncbi:PREDICTED: uncharacterized protein LOC109228784 [Nicotiana attenuata]|uniref:Uncharacterized protein n=1 Tax=Nicotiana attenuata TaxID=49451 RepID=A0A1J6IYQ5_NICAT|nr:PREDICTED: uncharacterized protein LOC109228784 [Nicotiana attenuata]OIT00241.1 hypothetical protein A4A49_19343 [Nicotiana attenuata]